MKNLQIGPKRKRPAGQRLGAFQMQCITLFVRAAAVFSLPRSIGQVYGILFATPRPLNLDELIVLLGSSRGGTHDAIKWLMHIGAVERVHLPGVRKEHYRSELNLRKLAAGYLRLKVEPHVENGADHILELAESIEPDGADAEFQHRRLDKIRAWHRVLSELLPMVKQIAEDR